MFGHRVLRMVVAFVLVSVVVEGVPWVLSALLMVGGTSAGVPLPIWTCTVLPPMPGFLPERRCEFSLLGALTDVVLCAALTFLLLRFLENWKTRTRT